MADSATFSCTAAAATRGPGVPPAAESTHAPARCCHPVAVVTLSLFLSGTQTKLEMSSSAEGRADDEEAEESSVQLSRNASVTSVASLTALLDGTDEREHSTLLRQTLAAFVRGASAGLALKGGLSLVSLLAKRKNRHRGAVREEAVSALRYSLFLASYASGFRLSDGLLRHLYGPRSDRWRAAVSGALVAPSYLIASSTPSPSLSIYIALRASLLALRAERARRRPPLTWAVSETLMKHSATLVMCSSASVLLHAWLMEPKTLDAGYVRFLDLHGGKGRGVVDAIGEMARHGRAKESLPAVQAWHVANGTSPSALHHLGAGTCVDPCAVVHPGEGHLPHALRFTLQGVLRALPVYLPVYIVSTAVVQRANLWKNPRHVLKRATLGMLRSSAFLSSYCALAWLSCCTMHSAPHKRPVTRRSVLLCAFPAGLAALIEKPSRRTELALFCSGHALHAATRLALQWGWAAPVPRADLALLTVSSSLIMDAYIHARHTFRPSFLNVFDWIFGYTWRRRGSMQSLLY